MSFDGVNELGEPTVSPRLIIRGFNHYAVVLCKKCGTHEQLIVVPDDEEGERSPQE